MRRPALLLLALVLAVGVPRAAQAQRAGSYLAMRIDNAPLPLADRVTDDDGTTYLVEFERLVLSLRSGNRFRAAVRFKRTLSTSGARSRQAPIQSMTVTGRYEVTGTSIRFLADSSSEMRGVRMLDGTVEGPQRISVPFDYRNGAVERKRVLKLEFRGDIL
ncbi:MAG: hypothetical protein KA761_14960 [Gemmatimonadaceae bacterium]|nr:hypothetical protein [Gemmatimonadaceae bacterium]